jgi:hypothetical protein
VIASAATISAKTRRRILSGSMAVLCAGVSSKEKHNATKKYGGNKWESQYFPAMTSCQAMAKVIMAR